MSESPLKRCRLYDHDAMNTTFSLRVIEEDPSAADDVAALCFDRLDQLEGQLSRYVDGSDVSRINEMVAGETLYLSEPCHRCLIHAMEAAVKTHGLFDITLGSRIEHQKTKEDGEAPEVVGRLSVHPDVPAITCDEAGRQIDLGGVGKGCALDELQSLLEEWEIKSALVSSGASSLLAYGDESWPIELRGDHDTLPLQLRSQAMSASGTGIQGSHIIHPWGDDQMPKEPCKRIWVIADKAAEAEVWSTALMLITPESVKEATAECSPTMQVYADRGGKIEQLR